MKVWEFVRSLLLDPERLRTGLERMIEQERKGMRGDPEHEAKVWLEKITEADRKRGGYLDLAATGRMSYAELDVKLDEIEKIRKRASDKLEVLKGHKEALEQLDQDRDALLEHYARMVPEGLDSLDTAERREVYEMLRLRATLSAEGVVR